MHEFRIFLSYHVLITSDIAEVSEKFAHMLLSMPKTDSPWSFLRNTLSEVIFPAQGECTQLGQAGGGPGVDDTDDLIDDERDDAEHEMAFDLECAADVEKSGAELVFQTDVDAFGHGAEIVDQVIEVGHVDELQALDFAAPFGQRERCGVAQLPAVIVDRGGVVGGVHEIVEIGPEFGRRPRRCGVCARSRSLYSP